MWCGYAKIPKSNPANPKHASLEPGGPPIRTLSEGASRAAVTLTIAHRQIPTEVYRPRIPTESVGRSGPWAAQPPVSRPLVARRRRDSNLGRSVGLVFSDSMPRVRSVGLGRLSYPHNGPSSHRKRKLHSQGSFTTRSDLGRTSVGRSEPVRPTDRGFKPIIDGERLWEYPRARSLHFANRKAGDRKSVV